MSGIEQQPFALDDDVFGDATSSTAPDADVLRGPKPITYYGEGPFDPPSSDEEMDDLLEKPLRHSDANGRAGIGLEEDGTLRVGHQKVCSCAAQ